MKPFSTMFLYASFGLATMTMGCAEMNGGATGASGSAAPPAASPPPAASSAPASSTTPAASTNSMASSSAKSAISVGSSDPTRVSTGTQGDTLEACTSRIPKDATDGQRMIATTSCERDAKARTSIDAVPGN